MTERDAFEREAKRLLEQHAEALDEPTQAELAAIRREALRRMTHAGAPRRMPAWLAPAGGLALASALLLWLLGPGMDARPLAPALEDVEILASDVEPELLEELEFCQWLAEREADHG